MTNTHDPVREALAESLKNMHIFANGALQWLDKSADVLMKREDNSPAGYQMNAYQRVQFLQAELKKLDAALASSPAVAAEAGEWVMVPREPTEAMQYAAERAYVAWSFAEVENSTFTHSDTYRAMIQAAPPAPSGVKVAEADGWSEGSEDCDGNPLVTVRVDALVALAEFALTPALVSIRVGDERLTRTELAHRLAHACTATPSPSPTAAQVQETAEHWMHKAHEFQAERDDLRQLLDTRPAINAGLVEAYQKWTGKVYAADVYRVAFAAGATPGEAQ